MKTNGLTFKTGKSSTGNIINDTLINHGIVDIDKYRSGDFDDIPLSNPDNLNNIEQAAKRLHKAVVNHENIGILVDGDADGFSSAAMLMKGLSDIGVDSKLIIPDHKSHGLETMMKRVLDSDITLLFTPDASSNDVEYHKELKKNNVDVVVLDHHIINDEGIETPAIIVNNQNNDNSDANSNYVGSGMVFLFMSYIHNHINKFDLSSLLPLLALGQVIDMSDVSDPEIRYYVQNGLNLFNKHKLFSYMVDFEPNVHNISFKIGPLLNAVARVGTLEQREELIYALAEMLPDERKVVSKRRKSKLTGKMETRDMTLNRYQIELDELKKIKSLQDRTVKKATEGIVNLSKKSDGIIIAQIPDDISGSITGLIAGKIMGNYQSPVMVVKESISDGVTYYRGSMRCPTPFELRSWLNDTGLVSASGHEQAAGVEFKASDVSGLLDKTRDGLNIVQEYYVVDKIYDEYSASQAQVREVNESIHLFGGKVKEPELGFKSLPINKNSIRNSGNMLKFSYNGLRFVLFAGADMIDYISTKTGFDSKIYVDILGSAARDDWGDGSPQVIIKDIAISSKENKVLTTDDLIF